MNLKFVGSMMILMAVTALTACQKDAQNVVDNVQRGVTELQLNHKWTTNCENANAAVFSFNLTSETEQYDIGSSLSKTTTFFASSGCTSGLVQIIENGNSHIGTQLSGNMSTFNIDFQSVSITPMTDTGRDTLNGISACGISNWVTGQSRDVTTATSSSPAADRCWILTPRTVFDLVQVTDAQLKFGLNENGLDKSTDQKRPVRIDDSKPLTKE